MNERRKNPRFGKYTLVSRLGMGGMAEVYKAQYKNDPNVVVAIKRILPQYSKDRKLVSMLINEARLSLGLAHPNIVPVIDFGVVEGNYFIAMEYVAGRDLKSIMIRCKSKGIELPQNLTVFVMSQVLRGLHFAHTKRDHFDQPLNIVHRDISPQNVMVSLWGQVKVLDFGIAKATSRAGQTQTGILKGKFSYMSPEQASGKDVDHRTDIYSAGILLWELLTLESYYEAETDMKLLYQVRDAKVRNPSSVNEKVPGPLASIVMKALQKKPKRRYQTALDFAETLEAYLEENFGKTRDADVAPFIRRLFNIPDDEIPNIRPSLAQVERAKHERTVQAPKSRASAPSHPFPDNRGTNSRFVQVLNSSLRIPFLIGMALVVVWILRAYPLPVILKSYDSWTLDIARRIRGGEPPKSASINKADSRIIELHMSDIPSPNFELEYSGEAKEQLDLLEFEDFERVRDRAEDLTFNPRPETAATHPEKPQLWLIEEAGHMLHYLIDAQRGAVRIEKVEKR